MTPRCSRQNAELEGEIGTRQAELGSLEMARESRDGALRELESEHRVGLDSESRAVDHRVRVEQLGGRLTEQLGVCKQHLQLYLDQLEACESESEIAQEADLKIQNWRFLLELQDEVGAQ